MTKPKTTSSTRVAGSGDAALPRGPRGRFAKGICYNRKGRPPRATPLTGAPLLDSILAEDITLTRPQSALSKEEALWRCLVVQAMKNPRIAMQLLELRANNAAQQAPHVEDQAADEAEVADFIERQMRRRLRSNGQETEEPEDPDDE